MGNIVNPDSISASPELSFTTLLATPSSAVKVEGKKTGVVAKVPAVIGKTIVQIYIEALAELKEPALEITNIKHDLYLTGCELMQAESATNGKLIIKGYIKEDIDYTPAKVGEDGILSVGNRRTGISIPFKCFTKIQLDSEPEASTSTSLVNPNELETVNAVNANKSYYSSTNEELSYEVAETKIRQVNVKGNAANVTINNNDEQAFSSFSINMAVDVTLVILQNQYVEIPGSGNSSSNNSSGGNSSKNESSSSGGSNNKSGNGNNSKENQKSGKKSGKKNGKSRSMWSVGSFMKMFSK